MHVAVSSTVSVQRQDHGPSWDRDGETVQSRLASSRRKGKGTGPWSRLVWSPTLNVLWKRACPRTERASERGSASIERSWIPCLLPPSVPAGRHSARSLGGGKNAQQAEGREEGKKDCAEWPGSYIHARTVPFLSSLLLESLSSASVRRGRVPGPGDTDARQPANLVPRCFFSASASILVSTLRCWAIPSGEESAVEENRREEVVACSRDGDARTYTHWHRGLHVRLRQTLTTERPEIPTW